MNIYNPMYALREIKSFELVIFSIRSLVTAKKKKSIRKRLKKETRGLVLHER